ncbi:MAG: polyphosphate polymerase domain-containing protein [Acidimicrobiales bacterium]
MTLDELNASAALQTRVDRKYVLRGDDLDRLWADLPAVRVLDIDGQRRFGYESTYFDTAGLDCYLAAARSRPNRFKVRTRTYLDSGTHVLELKTRDRSRSTVKTRTVVTDHLVDLDADAVAFIAANLSERLPTRAWSTELPKQLVPSLRTAYQRTTLLLDPIEHGAELASRATIDTSLTVSTPDGRSQVWPDVVIVETKSPGSPTRLDRLLWAAGHRPQTISKYGIGLAALQPALPAHKWRPVLRRHLGVGTNHSPRSTRIATKIGDPTS